MRGRRQAWPDSSRLLVLKVPTSLFSFCRLCLRGSAYPRLTRTLGCTLRPAASVQPAGSRSPNTTALLLKAPPSLAARLQHRGNGVRPARRRPPPATQLDCLPPAPAPQRGGRMDQVPGPGLWQHQWLRQHAGEEAHLAAASYCCPQEGRWHHAGPCFNASNARTADSARDPATWHSLMQVSVLTGRPGVAYRNLAGQGTFKVGACKQRQQPRNPAKLGQG